MYLHLGKDVLVRSQGRDWDFCLKPPPQGKSRAITSAGPSGKARLPTSPPSCQRALSSPGRAASSVSIFPPLPPPPSSDGWKKGSMFGRKEEIPITFSYYCSEIYPKMSYFLPDTPKSCCAAGPSWKGSLPGKGAFLERGPVLQGAFVPGAFFTT